MPAHREQANGKQSAAAHGQGVEASCANQPQENAGERRERRRQQIKESNKQVTHS
jgi:hypothetical protein